MPAGNSLNTATLINLTPASSPQTFLDTITPVASDYYRFTVTNRSSFNLAVTGLADNANVSLLDSQGNVLSLGGVDQTSTNSGNLAESINAILDVGTYYINILAGTPTATTDYTLNVSLGTDLVSNLLWRNQADGTNLVWFLDGTNFLGLTFIPSIPDPNWQIQGTGDFNSDGNTDIVWRNQADGTNLVWLMDGTTFTGIVNLPPIPDPNWFIEGTGDFNGDNKTDLVWRNQADGTNLIWLLDGTTLTGQVLLPPIADPNWEIQGTGDFNGDNKTDLVWRNQADGTNLIWFLDGTAFAGQILLPPIADPNWEIEGTGDFNSDNKTDLVWRNQADGTNLVWFLDGTTFTGQVFLPPIADPNWRLIAPFNLTGEPQVIDTAGNSLNAAFNLGSNLTGTGAYRGFAGSQDLADFYQFNLGGQSNIRFDLTNLAADLNLELLDSNGNVLQLSALTGNTSEQITATLAAGTYYARVFSFAGDSNYTLGLKVNNFPTLLTNGTLTLAEGGLGSIGSSILQTTDRDNTSSELVYTVGSALANGTLLLNGVSVGLGGTFTQLAIDNNLLSYSHSGSETTSDTFSFTVSDGAGGSLSSAFSFNITPVNDAPAIAAPTTQSVDQGLNTNIPSVSVADPDAGSGLLNVTLSVNQGVLTLGNRTGLNFLGGIDGIDDASISFTGTLTAVNNALATLIYRSSPSFEGADSLTIIVDDGGNTGSGGSKSDTKTIALNVIPKNDPPVITLPSTATTVEEDKVVALSGISINDPDAAGGLLTVSLSVTNGSLSLASNPGVSFLTGDGSNDPNLVFKGSLSVINAALGQLLYQGSLDYNGSDQLTVSVSDNGNTGSGTPLSDVKTLGITITPANDAPTLTLPPSITLNENASAGITNIRINDVDAGTGLMEVQLSVSNGVLTLGSTTGINFTRGTSNQANSLIFEGTLNALNDALKTLTYKSNQSIGGNDSLEVVVNDNGNTGDGVPRSADGTIPIVVLGINSPPVITLPSTTPQTNAGLNLPIPNILISDPDVGSGNVTLSIRAGNGILTVLPDPTITFLQGTTSQGNRITVQGTLAAINNTLASLVYRSNPSSVGFFESISIDVSDEGNTGIGAPLSDSKTLFINVGGAINQLPIANNNLYNTPRNQILNINTPGVLDNDSDPEGATLSATVLTNPANGTVTNFNSNGSFTYTPNNNFIGTDSFVYRVSDGIDFSSATVFVSVTNNAPTATDDLNFSTTHNQPLTIPAKGVLLNDTDPEGDSLTAVGVTTTSPSGGSLSLQGTGAFVYTPATGFTGVDSFTYRANDGVVNSANLGTILITVSAAANTPPVAVADTFEIAAGKTLNQPATGVLFNDTDAEGNSLTAIALATVSSGGGSVNLLSDGSFTYTPVASFVGVDSFTYRANDGTANSNNIGTVTINVTNTAPVAVNDNPPYTASFNTPLTIPSGTGVLANDTDTENNTLTAIPVSTTSTNGGTISLAPTGAFIYTPATGFTGVDTFTYRANDGFTNSTNLGTITVTVNAAANQAPTAVNDTFTVAAGGASTIAAIGVLAGDSDPENGTVGLTAIPIGTTTGAGGSFSLQGNGSFTYTPAAGFKGVDSFTYNVSDGTVNSTTPGTVTISVTNTAPVAVNDNPPYLTFLNTPLTVPLANGVLNNDTDTESNSLTAIPSTTTSAGGGTLSLNGNGSFVYTPLNGFTGVDSFTYKANDGVDDSANLGTVTITVNPANQAPTAVNDTFTVAAGGTSTIAAIGVLAGDSDPENGTVGLTAIPIGTTTGAGGSFSLQGNGSFTYTPAAGFKGVDSFTYNVSDGTVNSTTPGTVTISVTNTAPVAVNDNPPYITLLNTALTVPLANGVLNNDTDTENNSLTAIPSTTTSAGGGTLSLNGNGSFVYTPLNGFTGVDSFTYKANDGVDDSANLGTVTITVNASNTAPTAQGDSYRVLAFQTTATTRTIAAPGVLANDSDPELSPLTAIKLTDPTKGTLNLNADGSFTYSPIQGFIGIDSFTYQASDGLATSGTVTVLLSVSTNTAPVADDDNYTAVSGGTLSVSSVSGVFNGDTDNELDSLTAVKLSNPTQGTLTLNQDGSFAYVSQAGFIGVDSFTYQADDGLATSGTATAFITVVANAPPTAANNNYQAIANTPLTISAIDSVLSNDSDPNGTPLTAITSSTTTSNGTINLNTDGTFVYTPANGFLGVDSFIYQASDGIAAATATAFITVSNNTPPAVQNDNYSTSKNTPLTRGSAGGVLFNDTDTDGPTLTVVSSPTTTTAGGGTINLAADGSFVYTPLGDFTGVDSFTYQVSDSIVTSTAATVFITVTNNSPPTAVNETYSIVTNKSLTKSAAEGVLANDTDPDTGTVGLTAIKQLGGGVGNLTLNSDGSFVYTPQTGFVGVDTFVYQVSDGSLSTPATITISVTANAAPVANPDSYSVNQGNVLNASTRALGVLNNDTDAENDPLTVSVLTSTNFGTLIPNLADGTFIYTPNAGAAIDSFVYQLSDGAQNSAPATVTISVQSTSTPPVAVADSYSVNANSSTTVPGNGVLLNDTDAENDSLTALPGTTTSANGSIALNPDGSFVYTPTTPNFVGTETFTYQTSDGINTVGPTTILITVGATNNPPVVSVPGLQVGFTGTDLFLPPDLRITDPDAGNNSISVTLQATQGNLTLLSTTGLTVGGNGSTSVTVSGTLANINAALANLRYTPTNPLFQGADSIVITANDNGFTGGSGTPQTGSGTIAVTVTSGPSLVTDINRLAVGGNPTPTQSSSPSGLTAIGSTLYFSANDGFTGVELWKSDGTASGTTLVGDINPSTSGSSPANFTQVGNTVFFTANDGVNGTELWKLSLSGGAPTLVKDIRFAGSSSPTNLVNLNGTLFFRANDGTGNALWKSDGTSAGTVTVGFGSFTSPASLTVVGNTLYFTANSGTQLWKTDGTDAGTVLVQSIGTGANVSSLKAVGNTLFFVATDANGSELWRSDGTSAGTTRISDINPGAGSSSPSNLVVLGDSLYFFANNGSGNGLWKATATGTASLVQALSSAPSSLTAVGSTLYFVVGTGASTELWKSDGTTAAIVKNIDLTGIADPSLTNFNGALYFVAKDSSATKIWRSVGTSAGTIPVSNAFTGAVPGKLTATTDKLFFTADTGTSGVELWSL